MRRQKILLVIGIVALLILASSSYTGKDHGLNMVQDTPVKYRDGIYSGQSRYTYTDEPYWGSIRIRIEKGSFTGIDFMIRDSSLHETFNKKYKKHYKGNPEYIQQVKNDWKGVQVYPKRLMKTQDVNKTDAISGATWSYNIFKASAEDALKKAVER
jgi:major membrane immunogen (membrane-anchored lipoprotein)